MFIIFSFIFLLIIFSLSVIFTNHTIFALLFLIASFLSASFLLFFLECEFLALIFITIYVGAIAVLFLFSIIMLDFKKNSLQKNLTKFLPIGTFFGVILLIPIINDIYLFFPKVLNYNNSLYLKTNLNWFDISESLTETETLGKVLYTHFVLHFLLIGIILLVVLFGVVHLTETSSYNSDNKISSSKKQIMFKQLAKSTKLK